MASFPSIGPVILDMAEYLLVHFDLFPETILDSNNGDENPTMRFIQLSGHSEKSADFNSLPILFSRQATQSMPSRGPKPDERQHESLTMKYSMATNTSTEQSRHE